MATPLISDAGWTGCARHLRARCRGIAVLLACWLLATTGSIAASRPAIRGAHGMVVTPSAPATRVGLDVLRRGGNAVDAAVATTLALAVTHPIAGNVGGGGFLLYRSPAGEVVALDFREVAPRKLRPELFLDEEGRPAPGLSTDSGLAVGVPGTVAGLHRAHAEWGRLDWAGLVEPAVRLALDGFEVPPYLAAALVAATDRLRADPDARRIFLADDEPLHVGSRLVQPELGASLQRIGELGPAGFYEGRTAKAIIRTVQDAGGVMKAKDLARYRVVLRVPVEGRYRGYRVFSFPPPSSGGVALLQMLAMLERFDLRASGPGSSLTVHLMAEVERRAYADRSRWLGDPEFFDVPVRGLLDDAYLTERAAGIDPGRATPSARVLPGAPSGRRESDQTLHLSIADDEGGAVSLTTTLNGAFGAAIVARGTGILLNNEIDDFALAAGMPNQWGLLGAEANAVRGEKRPLSSMTPTIVERPEPAERPFLVLGSPGGGTIITSVLQVLVNVIDHGMPLQQAVDYPRFHHQWQPDAIRYEPLAFPDDVRRALTDRGHVLEPSERPLGNVNAIGVGSRGEWLGAPDPRRHGAAAGY